MTILTIFSREQLSDVTCATFTSVCNIGNGEFVSEGCNEIQTTISSYHWVQYINTHKHKRQTNNRHERSSKYATVDIHAYTHTNSTRLITIWWSDVDIHAYTHTNSTRLITIWWSDDGNNHICLQEGWCVLLAAGREDLSLLESEISDTYQQLWLLPNPATTDLLIMTNIPSVTYGDVPPWWLTQA